MLVKKFEQLGARVVQGMQELCNGRRHLEKMALVSTSQALRCEIFSGYIDGCLVKLVCCWHILYQVHYAPHQPPMYWS